MRAILRAALVLLATSTPLHADPTVGEPPEILLGNRLFDETRFAQFFWARSAATPNASLAEGDPSVAWSVTTGAPLPGPFAGQSINCRVCHLDIEHKGVAGGGGRNYSDFARRSPVPARDDGETLTVRNSQQLINSSLERPGTFALHFDGEFATLEDLVKGTLTGRNFGWYADERAIAVAHIAHVVRSDDGTGTLAVSFGGGSYAGQLRGTDPLAPTSLPIPTAMTVDVTRLDDEQVLDVVARFIAIYVRSLVAGQDAAGAFALSPYDVFLRKNGLPVKPARGEPDARYTKRLARRIAALDAPELVGPDDGTFLLHDRPFVFGPEELAGLRIFLARPRGGRTRGGVGNCLACHPAPAFTDFGFHDTGVSQAEYDAVHGAGRFAALPVPDLAARDADPAVWLPPSARHPRAEGRLRAIPSAERPGRADLGLWNVYRNPDVGDAVRQRALDRVVCVALGPAACRRRRRNPDAMLASALGLFKTPGLRDLSHSGPYLHDGSRDTLEDVVQFYRDTAVQARAGTLRNGSRALRGMSLVDADVAPLATFLRALDEDFE
jgi:cytochrome c peroxidase